MSTTVKQSSKTSKGTDQVGPEINLAWAYLPAWQPDCPPPAQYGTVWYIWRYISFEPGRQLAMVWIRTCIYYGMCFVAANPSVSLN
jgi:hypothetical protein